MKLNTPILLRSLSATSIEKSLSKIRLYRIAKICLKRAGKMLARLLKKRGSTMIDIGKCARLAIKSISTLKRHLHASSLSRSRMPTSSRTLTGCYSSHKRNFTKYTNYLTHRTVFTRWAKVLTTL